MCKMYSMQHYAAQIEGSFKGPSPIDTLPR